MKRRRGYHGRSRISIREPTVRTVSGSYARGVTGVGCHAVRVPRPITARGIGTMRDLQRKVSTLVVHPLVDQLRFARSEFRRCLAGVTDEDATRACCR